MKKNNLYKSSLKNVLQAKEEGQFVPVLDDKFFGGFSLVELIAKAPVKPTITGVLEEEAALFSTVTSARSH